MQPLKLKPADQCAVRAETVGKAICEALNLNSTRVQNIDIRIHAGEVVNVYVQLSPTVDEVGQICRVLKHYTLHPNSTEVAEDEA